MALRCFEFQSDDVKYPTRIFPIACGKACRENDLEHGACPKVAMLANAAPGRVWIYGRHHSGRPALFVAFVGVSKVWLRLQRSGVLTVTSHTFQGAEQQRREKPSRGGPGFFSRFGASAGIHGGWCKTQPQLDPYFASHL